MTLTLDISPEVEQALRTAADRVGITPDRYVLDLLHERLLLANGGPAGLSAVEAGLLERIGEALPESTWARYETLKAKREDDTLVDSEHAELIDLVNEVEIWNARRMEAVAELSKLRDVPFRELVRQLGLGAPAGV